MHLERGLCNRCTQFIRREMAQRTTTPWLSGGVVGAGGTVALIAAGAAVVSVVALPVGIMAGVAHRWLQRRLLIRKMGPALSASVGELPQVPHDHTRFPEPSNNVPPPGSW